MRRKFLPSFFTEHFPFHWDFENFWENEEEIASPSGLSISEDDKFVYVEAALPGVSPEEVEVTFDKGILWIKAQRKEEKEEKEKKYYRKASRSYSYRVAVPGNIDENKEPEATFHEGIMTIKFSKTEKAEPKKIQVKRG
ncbi:MAG: hypothetical protein Tsb0015_15940 [Simkaniaceae bacterium]